MRETRHVHSIYFHLAQQRNIPGYTVVSNIGKLGRDFAAEPVFAAGVPWGFSRGDREQARALNILEAWGRERCACGDLWEGGRKGFLPPFP